MTTYANPNFIKASRLIMASAVIGIFGFVLLGDLVNFNSLFHLAIILILYFGIAFFIRKQHTWAKWLLVVIFLCYAPLTVWLLFFMPAFYMSIGSIGSVVIITKVVLEGLDVVFLFLKPKLAAAEVPEADTIGSLDALDE